MPLSGCGASVGDPAERSDDPTPSPWALPLLLACVIATPRHHWPSSADLARLLVTGNRFEDNCCVRLKPGADEYWKETTPIAHLSAPCTRGVHEWSHSDTICLILPQRHVVNPPDRGRPRRVPYPRRWRTVTLAFVSDPHSRRSGTMSPGAPTPRPPAVIFDMDGTLIDSEPLYLAVESGICDRYGKDIRPLLPDLLGRTARDCAVLTLERLGITQLTVEEYLAEREAALLAIMPSVQLLPGVDRLVRHLHASGVPIAVATSSPGDLFAAKSSRHGPFFALFGAVVHADMVAAGKPAPDLFLEAARRLGVSPVGCVAVEDAPAGVVSAKAAGMVAVALPNEAVGRTSYVTAGADIFLDRIDEMPLKQLGLPSWGEEAPSVAATANGHVRDEAELVGARK